MFSHVFVGWLVCFLNYTTTTTSMVGSQGSGRFWCLDRGIDPETASHFL